MMWLTEDTLGRLDLGPPEFGGGCSEDGVVVTEFEIGSPEVREVVRERALADGVADDTAYVGARAISVSCVIQQGRNWPDPQTTIDRIAPYLSPRYRPRLHWTIPGSTEQRSAVVRGVDAPLTIDRERFHTMDLAWVAPRGYLEAVNETCLTIDPSDDVEDGRTYDLTFDRTYPFSNPIGARNVTNAGNAIADWTATIFGACTNPKLTVNGTDIYFNRDGGLTLTGGTSVLLDSRQRTILLNGDPTESRYDKINFTDWSWEQVRLVPGSNLVRFEADSLDPNASVRFCFRSAYL